MHVKKVASVKDSILLVKLQEPSTIPLLKLRIQKYVKTEKGLLFNSSRPYKVYSVFEETETVKT